MFHVCDRECSEYQDKDHPLGVRWRIDDMSFRRCPHTYLTENVGMWLMAFNMFRKGIMPNSGGFLNQTNKYIEIMNFMLAKLQETELENQNGK